jgi:hypothetical protein
MARSGSIAVAAGSDLRYQGNVTFDSEVTSKLLGYEYPMIYVEAFQDGVLVYGQLDHPDAVFVLGGGSSEWVTRGGGPAHCRASLMIYGGRHNIMDPFVAAVEFEAAG